MHILFITGEFPPMQGGVGAYTYQLAAALAHQSVHVSVLTSVSAAVTGSTTGTDAALSAGIDIHPLITRWNWRIWRGVRELAHDLGADWLHVQYQTAAFAMNPAINLAPQRWQQAGLRVAWTYHDLLVPYLFPKAGAKLRRWVTERPAFSANLVVVTNEGDRLQLAGRAKNLVSIPIGSNVVGRRLSDDERTARRRRHGYSNRTLVIGYFGFLNRSKGGVTLVRTLQRLVQAGRDAQLLMIGDQLGASDPTNQAYLAEVGALIGELGLIDRVRWTGRQPDEEVSADLNAVDVLLMPYEDGASLRRGTLMAGLANGCAIVTTTPQAPLPELLDGRDLLYVSAGDDAACAAAVLRLADERMLAATLRENAYAASRLFTWDAIAQQHLARYSMIGDL
jgi:glycosyltransferase involved in cell wall biosynthesis